MPTNLTLNYIGVALVVISSLFYFFVKSEGGNIANRAEEQAADEAANSPEVEDIGEHTSLIRVPAVAANEGDIFSRLGPNVKRVIGISLAVISGLLYGEAFTPILYVKDRYENASQNNLDYLFSFYCGILMASVSYFIIYSVFMKNKPIMYNQIYLPGITSGKLNTLVLDH